MKFPVYNIKGETTGIEIEIPDDIAQLEPNRHAIYLAVKRQLARMRQGNHSTKTRADVRGGGKKPWKQKGRGGARAGTNRSPIWRGGGRTFGPKPHLYDVHLNAQVLKLARKSAFAARIQDGSLKVVEDFKFQQPKTKELFGILKGFKTEHNHVILLLQEYDTTLHLSARNIPYCQVQKSAAVSAYELVRHKMILLQQSAVQPLVEALQNAQK
ncbi:MAG: 50S ribosomal protein L4 [bacterium]|nr:50S ribosomal protein L4 [bacterium]